MENTDSLQCTNEADLCVSLPTVLKNLLGLNIMLFQGDEDLSLVIHRQCGYIYCNHKFLVDAKKFQNYLEMRYEMNLLKHFHFMKYIFNL